jgi:outer membrane protein assembly factor BamB
MDGAPAMRPVRNRVLYRLTMTFLTMVLMATVMGPVGADAHTGALELSMLWASHLKVPGPNQDLAEDLGVSPDGASVFVTGVAGSEYATVGYDAATGTQRWVSSFHGPFRSGYDAANALVVSPDGNKVFVTGHIQTSNTDSAYATIAYDAITGAQLWVAAYRGADRGDNLATAIAVSPDGAIVYVTGSSDGPVTTNFATLAYDAPTGHRLWVTREDGDGPIYPTAMGVSPDGTRVMVTGWGASGRFTTVSYETTTGARQWAAPDWHGSYANALAISPDGGTVVVTGTGCEGYGDVTTFAYDTTTGKKVWAACWDGPTHVSDGGMDLAISHDGSSVFVTGDTEIDPCNGGFNMVSVAYSLADGHQLWSRIYDSGPHDDHGVAVDAMPDGRTVFVTGRGHVPGVNGDSYVILAYDASTGRPLARAGIGPGDPTSLSVSPDGSDLYVTGWFGQLDPLYYGTVAYSTSLSTKAGPTGFPRPASSPMDTHEGHRLMTRATTTSSPASCSN